MMGFECFGETTLPASLDRFYWSRYDIESWFFFSFLAARRQDQRDGSYEETVRQTTTTSSAAASGSTRDVRKMEWSEREVANLIQNAPPNSVRQRINVEREEEEILGPLPLNHADGTNSGPDGLLNFDTVSEKVDLGVADGIAQLAVKVRCERVVPIRGVEDMFKKSSVIVTRLIEIDLDVTPERRHLLENILRGSHQLALDDGRGGGSRHTRNEARLSTKDTFKLYKTFMGMAEMDDQQTRGETIVEKRLEDERTPPTQADQNGFASSSKGGASMSASASRSAGSGGGMSSSYGGGGGMSSSYSGGGGGISSSYSAGGGGISSSYSGGGGGMSSSYSGGGGGMSSSYSGGGGGMSSSYGGGGGGMSSSYGGGVGLSSRYAAAGDMSSRYGGGSSKFTSGSGSSSRYTSGGGSSSRYSSGGGAASSGFSSRAAFSSSSSKAGGKSYSSKGHSSSRMASQNGIGGGNFSYGNSSHKTTSSSMHMANHAGDGDDAFGDEIQMEYDTDELDRRLESDARSDSHDVILQEVTAGRSTLRVPESDTISFRSAASEEAGGILF